MAVDEQARHRLHMRLDEVLGPEVTGTLMELLPPLGWADVATRQDIDALGQRIDARIGGLRSDTTAEVGGLRTEVRTGLVEVRSEIAGLRSDTTAEVGELRTEVRTGLAELGTEVHTGLAGVRSEMADMRADLTNEIATSQRLLLFGMLAAMFSLAGLVWGALTFAG